MLQGGPFDAESAGCIFQSERQAVKEPAVVGPPVHFQNLDHAMVIQVIHVTVLAQVEDVVGGVDGQHTGAPALLSHAACFLHHKLLHTDRCYYHSKENR